MSLRFLLKDDGAECDEVDCPVSDDEFSEIFAEDRERLTGDVGRRAERREQDQMGSYRIE